MGNFPKIHPFWRLQDSLIVTAVVIYSLNGISQCYCEQFTRVVLLTKWPSGEMGWKIQLKLAPYQELKKVAISIIENMDFFVELPGLFFAFWAVKQIDSEIFQTLSALSSSNQFVTSACFYMVFKAVTSINLTYLH